MSARVLVIGAGGLGSPVALALAASPERPAVLTLIDPDRVELSNLHRQLLHGEGDLGRPKVESGAERLRATARASGGELEIRALAARLDPERAPALFAEHDLVIEGSDDLDTKFLVNDTALACGVPAIIGGVVQWRGQVLGVLPRPRSASGEPGPPPAGCYRCLFEAPPPEGEVATCQQSGVLGPACGVVGGVMAAEALRLLRGQRPVHAGALLLIDLLRFRVRRLPLRPRPGCPACG